MSLRVIAIIIVAVARASCGVGSADAGDTIEVVRITGGLQSPVAATAPPADSTRLFVLEQYSGKVRILDLASRTILPTPFVTVSGATGNNEEQGLLGLAFHPEFPDTPHVYVNFTNSSGANVIRRYSLASDPNVVDPGSAVTMLTQPTVCGYHNAGWLGFGPDGYLYIPLGEGACGGEFSAQNDAFRRGKILRLDVDHGLPYTIPATNPWAASPPPKNELWAKGLRNPWQCSFDRETGDFYIADPGSGREELDVQPGSSPGGENYGWNWFEGYALRNCPTPCDSSGLVRPVLSYEHEGLAAPCAIVGGHVYRGSAIPELRGAFVFGDYCDAQVWTARVVNGVATELRERTAEIKRGTASTLTLLASIAVDGAGELYLVIRGAGEIWKVVSDDGVVSVPSLGAPARLSLGPGRPNPARSTITCRLALPVADSVTLRVFDSSGRLVDTLIDERLTAGVHDVTWNGRDGAGRRAPAGVYLWQVRAGTTVSIRKTTLVR